MHTEGWELSFSYDIKTRLAAAQPGCEFCPAAELYGILKFASSERDGALNIVTEHKGVADRLEALFAGEIGFVPSKEEYSGGYRFKIESDARADIIYQKLDLGGEYGIPREEIMPFRCCRISYIRGTFLGGGSISDPKKNYHMEFVSKSESAAEELADILKEEGIDAKVASRKNKYMVYLKEYEEIASLLGLIGAGGASMEIYNISIEKEIRNAVNRRMNCENANIDKVIKAYGKHMLAIEKIKNTIGLEKLPESLREIAKVRMENPDESLKELGKRLKEPIGKSGVNHRLNRILEIAEDIK